MARRLPGRRGGPSSRSTRQRRARRVGGGAGGTGRPTRAASPVCYDRRRASWAHRAVSRASGSPCWRAWCGSAPRSQASAGAGGAGATRAQSDRRGGRRRAPRPDRRAARADPRLDPGELSRRHRRDDHLRPRLLRRRRHRVDRAPAAPSSSRCRRSTRCSSCPRRRSRRRRRSTIRISASCCGSSRTRPA